VKSQITHEQVDLTTCVLHFSGADFRCGVRPHDAERFARTGEKLFDCFNKLSLAQVVREIDREFPGRDYTLRDLFLDERREVANLLLRETMARYESDYLQIYEQNRRLIDFLREIDSPVPRPLQVAADVAVTHEAVDAARRLGAGEPWRRPRSGSERASIYPRCAALSTPRCTVSSARRWAGGARRRCRRRS